ncbi:preprotein translocase subunit SecE [Neisseria sp. HSC-16F19]|nr:preprotein translocase subunit SecE [Neisseria sp. HSC-16F19]MCP2041202.1 preprotein translocase subunit SecE [Neisseria sp. HSC-16F19]
MSNKPVKEVAVAKPKVTAKTEAKIREQQEKLRAKRGDMGKFLLAAILVAAGVYGFYALEQVSVYVRALIPVAAIAAAVAIVFFWSSTGVDLVRYVKDSVTELKKVVWPERNETLRTSLFVLAFTTVLVLFVWAADALISWVLFDLLMKRG